MLPTEDPGAAVEIGCEDPPTVEGAWEETCGTEVSEVGFCEVGGAEKLEGATEGESGVCEAIVVRGAEVCWPDIGKGLLTSLGCEAGEETCTDGEDRTWDGAEDDGGGLEDVACVEGWDDGADEDGELPEPPPVFVEPPEPLVGVPS